MEENARLKRQQEQPYPYLHIRNKRRKQELLSFAQSAKSMLQELEESTKQEPSGSSKPSLDAVAEQPKNPALERAKIVISIQNKDEIKQFRIYMGVYCSLRQLLEVGFFHADPHPGNLFATSSGSLAYLDFGMGDIPRHYCVGLIQVTSFGKGTRQSQDFQYCQANLGVVGHRSWDHTINFYLIKNKEKWTWIRGRQKLSNSRSSLFVDSRDFNQATSSEDHH